jgi:energy-converting hydrogenase Eha subunit H
MLRDVCSPGKLPMWQTKGFSIITESPWGKEAHYLTGEIQMIFRTPLMSIKFRVATNCEQIINISHRKIREKLHVSTSKHFSQIILCMRQTCEI